jgi:superfamily II DNA/RNA helicase
MPFKKLHPHLKEMLASQEITLPTPFQSASIPVIKSGSNTYCTAPKGSGRTTTLILTTLHKLKCEEVGDAPRAIVLVENREKALETYNAFLKYIRFTTTRVYFADEKLHVDLLKSEIFDGVDVLIATPQTLRKLSSLNGVNTTQLKIFNIDDAEFLIQNSAYTGIMSITQSITKCQFVLYSDKMIPTLKRFESYFMKHSKKIAL